MTPEFREYGRQTLANSRALAKGLLERGVKLVTGGTDNHMMVTDVTATFGIDGRTAESILDRVCIATNKQVIPDDPNPPLRPSGLRLGTPAATTRGMKEDDMWRLAGWIVAALSQREDPAALEYIRRQVVEFCLRFPVPGID
jgi:glycine hydroxymethyltransferase